MQDEDRVMEAVKQVDVVICAVSSKQTLDQKLLIHAIKRTNCIKVILFLHNFPMVLSALKWIHMTVLCFSSDFMLGVPTLQFVNSHVNPFSEPVTCTFLSIKEINHISVKLKLNFDG